MSWMKGKVAKWCSMEKMKWAYSDACLSQTMWNHAKKSMKRLVSGKTPVLGHFLGENHNYELESYGSCHSNGEALSKNLNPLNCHIFYVASGKLFYMIQDCIIWCFEYSGCELINSSSASSYVSKWYRIIIIMIITMHLHVRIMEMRVLRTPACKCHSHLRACVMVTCVQVS